jgi:purine-binding chemotaxis protein CheW
MRHQRFSFNLAASQPDASGDVVVALCAFRVGAEEYAIDLRRVEEILRPPRVARVPNAPSFLEGVINFRGAIVPVIDLRKALGLGPYPAGTKQKCMICRLGGERVAILVESATQMVRVPMSDLRPAPPLMANGARPYVIGVCGADDQLKLLLDIKALFHVGNAVSPGPGK